MAVTCLLCTVRLYHVQNGSSTAIDNNGLPLIKMSARALNGSFWFILVDICLGDPNHLRNSDFV